MSSKAALEVGPPSKRKKLNTPNISKICFLCKELCKEQHTYTQTQWDTFKLTAKEWSGLDRYGYVYLEVDWEKGTKDEQSFFHRKCTKNMQTRSKLLQAQKRKNKDVESSSASSTTEPSNSNLNQTVGDLRLADSPLYFKMKFSFR